MEKAFEANGAKFFTQLEIDAGFDGVPVLAHLDFVLVGKGAVSGVGIEKQANLPEHLYTAYLTQVYGQLGFLAKYWEQPRFRSNVTPSQILTNYHPYFISVNFNRYFIGEIPCFFLNILEK